MKKILLSVLVIAAIFSAAGQLKGFEYASSDKTFGTAELRPGG